MPNLQLVQNFKGLRTVESLTRGSLAQKQPHPGRAFAEVPRVDVGHGGKEDPRLATREGRWRSRGAGRGLEPGAISHGGGEFQPKDDATPPDRQRFLDLQASEHRSSPSRFADVRCRGHGVAELEYPTVAAARRLDGVADVWR